MRFNDGQYMGQGPILLKQGDTHIKASCDDMAGGFCSLNKVGMPPYVFTKAP